MMKPDDIAAQQEQLLELKAPLLEEMLEITKEYSDFLTSATSIEDVDQVIERTNRFLEERARLMERVNELDKRHRGMSDAATSQMASSEELRTRFRHVLNDLLELQSSIDAQLSNVQRELRERVGKAKRSRQLVKGYYNQQLAARPRFVDDKR